jgi:hypothetical protein
MRRTKLVGTFIVAALGLTACTDPMSAPAPGPATVDAELALVAGGSLQRGSIQLPAGGRITDQQLQELAGRAINPGDYVCPPSTPAIDFYLNSAFDIIDNEPAIFDLLYNQLLADLVPTYHALYFLEESTPQYFGYNGEYTHVMQKTHRDAKRFFDIESSDIQLIGMHGSMLNDAAAVSQTYQFVFGVPAADADFFAALIQNALATSTTINGGNHPLFSFNAFAISAPGFVPDKIVMGDGIMAAYEAIGFGDVAPQGIYAHEFGHHIQFENGYFDDDEHANTGTGAERTRYTELMADAYSAYFMTHARGLALNKHRVAQFLEVFYNIGDCAYTNNGHHGTPNQRMRAAQFGFDVADQAQKQGHILSTEAFHDMFVAAYGDLIAPDAI